MVGSINSVRKSVDIAHPGRLIQKKIGRYRPPKKKIKKDNFVINSTNHTCDNLAWIIVVSGNTIH